MTNDKADYTGQINTKKLTGTGITEDLLARHHRAKGGQLVIVAAVSVSATGDKVKEGTGSVQYVIDDLEVAPEGTGAEHIRELIHLFHYERQLKTDGPELDYEGDGPAPKVTDVLEQSARFRPHPYIASTLSTEDEPVCDVCGNTEDTPVHADRARMSNPFGAQPEPDEEEPQATNVFRPPNDGGAGEITEAEYHNGPGGGEDPDAA